MLGINLLGVVNGLRSFVSLMLETGEDPHDVAVEALRAADELGTDTSHSHLRIRDAFEELIETI